MANEMETLFDVDEVKARLKRLELSQTQFAALLRMEQSALSRALAGKRKFQLAEKRAIIECLDGLEAEVQVMRPADSVETNRTRNLAAQMRWHGLSSRDVEIRSGINKVLIEMYRDGATMPDEHAEALSEALGETLDRDWREVIRVRPSGRGLLAAAIAKRRAAGGEDGIPLYAAPEVVGAGYFRFLEDRLGVVADLSVERLGQGAYGLYVPEYGLEPVFEAGHVLLLLPAKPVSVGGWAAVLLRDSRVVFGRIRKTDGEGVVVMLPAGDDVTVARSEVSRVHMFGGVWFG